jgi:hypothetical protein
MEELPTSAPVMDGPVNLSKGKIPLICCYLLLSTFSPPNDNGIVIVVMLHI